MGYCHEEDLRAYLTLATLVSSLWLHPQLLIFQQREADGSRQNRNERTVGFAIVLTFSFVVWLEDVLNNNRCWQHFCREDYVFI
jgi:hypothetical protein